MATKKTGAGKPKPPTKPPEPKAPEVKAQTSTEEPPVEVPKGKRKCQFCTNILPLKRGDGSISRLQGNCDEHKKIVWMTFCCDQFNYKQP